MNNLNKEFRKISEERNKIIPTNILNKNSVDEYSLTNDKKIITCQKDLIINNNYNVDITKGYENLMEERALQNNNLYQNMFGKNHTETIKVTKKIDKINNDLYYFNEQKKKTQNLLNKLL